LLKENGARSYAQSFTAGSQWAFWVCAGISVVGLIATLTLVRTDELAKVEEAAVLT
jgi:hypothetical protein